VSELAPGLDSYAGHLAEVMETAWQEDWISQCRIWPFQPEDEATEPSPSPKKASKETKKAKKAPLSAKESSTPAA
jgi:hypothetical protein